MNDALHLIGELDELCSRAQFELTLVAPFIKHHVLDRLLKAVGSDVMVRVVTRWRPQEIRAGVSDLEVWDVIVARPRATLLLRPDLHAKYYRADEQCLVGSANLTGAALGLSSAPNLELLIPVSPEHAGVVGFEERLLAGAVTVNSEHVGLTRTAVDLLPAVPRIDDPPEGHDDIDNGFIVPWETWIPTLRQPEDLFVAYIGRSDTLSKAAQRGAARDLAVLQVPCDLDQTVFRAYVGALLMQTSVPAQIDSFVSIPRRFGEVRDHLTRIRGSSDSPDQAWQVLFRWMIHFLPERYEYSRPQYSELIARSAKAADPA